MDYEPLLSNKSLQVYLALPVLGRAKVSELQNPGADHKIERLYILSVNGSHLNFRLRIMSGYLLCKTFLCTVITPLRLPGFWGPIICMVDRVILLTASWDAFLFLVMQHKLALEMANGNTELEAQIKVADNICKAILSKLSSFPSCVKASITVAVGVSMAYGFYLLSPGVNPWNWDGWLLLSKTHSPF